MVLIGLHASAFPSGKLNESGTVETIFIIRQRQQQPGFILHAGCLQKLAIKQHPNHRLTVIFKHKYDGRKCCNAESWAPSSYECFRQTRKYFSKLFWLDCQPGCRVIACFSRLAHSLRPLCCLNESRCLSGSSHAVQSTHDRQRQYFVKD